MCVCDFECHYSAASEYEKEEVGNAAQQLRMRTFRVNDLSISTPYFSPGLSFQSVSVSVDRTRENYFEWYGEVMLMMNGCSSVDQTDWQPEKSMNFRGGTPSIHPSIYSVAQNQTIRQTSSCSFLLGLENFLNWFNYLDRTGIGWFQCRWRNLNGK